MSVVPEKSIRWLTFDVLGTCVDWRLSLREDGAREWKRLGMEPAIDWSAFTSSWEVAYAHGIVAANSPGPWTPATQVIRNGLEEALASIGLDDISEERRVLQNLGPAAAMVRRGAWLEENPTAGALGSDPLKPWHWNLGRH